MCSGCTNMCRRHPKRRLILCSLTAALAGFLFGFDTIVISGAEQEIQQLWDLSSSVHGICLSAALWGTLLGSLLGGYPTEKWGRRPTLLWVGVVYVVASLGTAVAWVSGPSCTRPGLD
jgi:MFS transporter, SP family, arabinose:H+ symporter